jgi:hypothetical protein
VLFVGCRREDSQSIKNPELKAVLTGNNKPEARTEHSAGINPNFETISNIQNTKALLFGTFKHLVFGFVSDFDIRISDLLKLDTA